ncbi:MAG: ABC transporter permease [Chloroflexota bacterium]
MTGLVRAELLKLRRRWATWIVLGALIGVTGLIYLVIAISGGGPRQDAAVIVTRFPGAYGVLNQLVFGLGSLLAIAWAAALAGSDWTWGTVRVVMARGEGRVRYVVAKAIALGLALVVAVLIAYAAGLAFAVLAGTTLGVAPPDPLAPRVSGGLVQSLALGIPVLLERAAIGFAVAIILRSQLAGVVVGILLSLGEGILTTVLVALDFRAGEAAEPGVAWYQLLPFGVGDSLIAAAPGTSGNLGTIFGEPAPVELAAVLVFAYLAIALGAAALAAARAEIA